MTPHAPEWKTSEDGAVWLSHVTLRAEDLDRLRAVSHVTMWNVRMPAGFLSELRELSWLDIPGGTASDLSLLRDCEGLRGLVVNQVRGLQKADEISRLDRLEILDLYGLARLEHLPSFERLTRLRRLHVGQLRALRNWDALLGAPALRELMFQNALNPDMGVLTRLAERGELEAFDWFAPDEPAGKVETARKTLGLPRLRPMRPEEWFEANVQS